MKLIEIIKELEKLGFKYNPELSDSVPNIIGEINNIFESNETQIIYTTYPIEKIIINKKE